MQETKRAVAIPSAYDPGVFRPEDLPIPFIQLVVQSFGYMKIQRLKLWVNLLWTKDDAKERVPNLEL